MMPSCQKVTELLSLSKEQPLPWRQRVTLRFHLAMCDACTHFSTQLDELQAISGRYLSVRDGDADEAANESDSDAPPPP